MVNYILKWIRIVFIINDKLIPNVEHEYTPKDRRETFQPRERCTDQQPQDGQILK